jgi:hypothetical protein
MPSKPVVWALLSMLSLFVFPQLLGVLLYLRLARFSRWLGRVLGVLGPGLVFLYLAPLFFFSGFREAQLKGEMTCGLPALAATIMVLFGTGVQLFVSLCVQMYLFRRET